METLKHAYQSQTLVSSPEEGVSKEKSIQNKRLNSIKGFVYGFIYTILDVISYIIIKRAPTLNGFNHAAPRFVIQFMLMGLIMQRNHLSIRPPVGLGKMAAVRAISGSSGVVFGYLSLKFITVADSQTLVNSSVLMCAIMGRFFLKDKITISHMVALLLTILGVVFILRPTFLFGLETNLEAVFQHNITEHNLNVTGALNATADGSVFFFTQSMGNIIGVTFVLMDAFLLSISHVTTRSLANSKVHYSLIAFWPCFWGFPVSVFFSIFLYFLSFNLDAMTANDVMYSLTSGVFGAASMIFCNKALECEDAAKISMIRITGVLFSMVFQYYFLGVEIDFLGVIGSILIILGTMVIILIKLFSHKILKSGKFYRVIAVEF